MTEEKPTRFDVAACRNEHAVWMRPCVHVINEIARLEAALDAAVVREGKLREALKPLAGITQGLHQFLWACCNQECFNDTDAVASAKEWAGELEEQHYAIGDALSEPSSPSPRVGYVTAAIRLAEAYDAYRRAHDAYAATSLGRLDAAGAAHEVRSFRALVHAHDKLQDAISNFHTAKARGKEEST